jgi:hypothetical protein
MATESLYPTGLEVQNLESQIESQNLEVQESELPESESSESDLLESEADTAIAIANISEPTLLRYFETFNSGEFDSTAALFAATGALYPPFESSIVGPEAIAAYLAQEAKGMKAMPREGVMEATEEGDRAIKVLGKVQTSLFIVNVSWHFVLNAESEILAVRLKLLAALEELLHLRR